MTNQISFEGIGGDIATFHAETGVQPGQVVKLTADSTVAPCAAGERFCGVAVNARDGLSAVQFGGFVRLACADESVTPGFVKLTADGSGGVFLQQAEVWLDFLDARGISWCGWSLCDKNESSAALRPGAPPDGPWDQSHLSESGRFMFSRFRS